MCLNSFNTHTSSYRELAHHVSNGLELELGKSDNVHPEPRGPNQVLISVCF